MLSNICSYDLFALVVGKSHVGGVRNGSRISILGLSLSLDCASFCMRATALKLLFESAGLEGARCPPKKLVIAKVLRGSGFVAELGRGLELELRLPPGWKVCADGFGLNS